MTEADKIAILYAINFFKPPSYLYDDNDDDIEVIIKVLSQTSDEIPKIEGYVTNIIPLFSSEHFKSHFRVTPCTFEFILNNIGEKLHGREMISPKKQLLITLWRFATPDSYRSIIQRFNVGKGTAIRAVRRVTKALCEISQRFIIWPKENAIQDVVLGFSRIKGFPGTIGAIDGTHIVIPAPQENPEAYINRKGRHSIQLQAVCDHKMRFTHLYVGNVGSVHDSRVFRLSSLQQYIDDPSQFPNDTHIIGDAAYKLHEHLLVPYLNNGHLTERQKHYNSCLSSTRMVIERSFGYLKGRWRSLLHVLPVNDITFAPYQIFACCILHNICLLQKDEIELENEFNMDENEPEGPRERIIEHINRNIAINKRNTICDNL